MESTQINRVLVIATEPSADLAAAEVVRSLRTLGGLDLEGIGGPEMASAGVSLLARVDSIAGMGLTDPLRQLGGWSDIWLQLTETLRRSPPHVALLVDGPDFNLPLARVLKELGVPVIYYVGPQVWAWRRRRLALMKKRVAHCALVLPFELPLYRKLGVPASYVGHPLLDRSAGRSRDAVREQLKVGPTDQLVAMLPGSRLGEVDLIAPPMIAAAEQLQKRGIQVRMLPGGGLPTPGDNQSFGPVSVSAGELLLAADAAIVASGTATLEAALSSVPFAIVYKVSRLTAWAARRFVKTPYVGLPNWILQRQAVDEILQDRLTPGALVDQIDSLLEPQQVARFAGLSDEVRGRLGTAGAAKRVADLVWKELRGGR